MRAGTAIFRHVGIDPLDDCLVVLLTDTLETVPPLAKLHLKHDRDMFAVLSEQAGISRDDVLKARLFGRLENGVVPQEFFGPSARLDWSVEDGKGIYIARGQCASVYTGRAERFEEATGGQIIVAGPELVSVTVTALDPPAFLRKQEEGQLDWSRKILVTACGRCENTGMIFSRDRRTVGTNWGSSPVRIQAVKGTLVLPAGQWICHALGPDGLLGSQVPILFEAGKSILQMEPQYKTMWYLLTRNTRQE